MQLLTGSETRKADTLATARHGISTAELIERAGRGVALSLLIRESPHLGRVLVLAGPGNNGGDGRVAARILKERGISVQVLSLQEAAGIPWREAVQRSSLIVDGLYGTGLSRPISGLASEIIDAVNGAQSAGKRVVSIDIPSGLSADKGTVLGTAVRATRTLTLGLPKVGLFIEEGPSHAGEIETVDIGIPTSVYDSITPRGFLIERGLFSHLFVPRPLSSHKGENGHLLLVGGTPNRLGAILLAARAALRSGAGLVTVGLPESAFRKIPRGLLEVMYEPLAAKPLKKILECLKQGKMDAAAVGPGMGVSPKSRAFLAGLIARRKVPIVLDADALNNLAGRPNLLKKGEGPMVLTPHPGEFSRLTGQSLKSIQSDRIARARDFAIAHGVILVLKGYRSVVAVPEGDYYINPTGNPAMATAGMGDALTGLIGSLVVQGVAGGKGASVLEAVLAGVYLHGEAGDQVASRLGDRGLLASDLIEELPKVIARHVSASRSV